MVRFRSIQLIVFALLVVACGDSTSDTAETYSSAISGISIDVPTNFQIIDDTTEDLPDLLADTDLPQNAQLVIAGTLSSPRSGFLMWAFDFESGDETFVPNLNIVRQPREPGQTTASVRSTLAADYDTGAGAEVLSIEETTVATGDALLVEALFPIAGVEQVSHGFQLIAFTDGFTYTITYSFIDPKGSERAAALRSFESFTADR